MTEYLRCFNLMNILITGGAGFIGSNLALALQKQGHHLTIIDNFSSGDEENLKGYKGSLLRGDVTNNKLFTRLKKEEYKVIFHQASITDTTYANDKKMISDNVEGFKNILNFANDIGAKLIYASSAAVYGNGPVPMKEQQKLFPLNSYAISKYKMDKMTETQNSNPVLNTGQNCGIIGLRYFNIYGPKEAHKGKSSSMVWQLSQIIKEKKVPRIFKYGLQSRDFIYVKDIVAANIRAMESDAKGIFNIGTGKPTTFNRIIEILRTQINTDKSIEYIDNPYNFYQNHTQADTNSTSKVLRWKSKFSIEEGIKDYLSFLWKQESMDSR